MRIPFGRIDEKTLSLARRNIAALLEGDHLTEGQLVAEFEREFQNE